MAGEKSVKNDLDRELERIEEEIVTHRKTVENLVWQRSELLTKKQDLDMYELIDCINENCMTANSALEILNNSQQVKRKLNYYQTASILASLFGAAATFICYSTWRKGKVNN